MEFVSTYVIPVHTQEEGRGTPWDQTVFLSTAISVCTQELWGTMLEGCDGAPGLQDERLLVAPPAALTLASL